MNKKGSNKQENETKLNKFRKLGQDLRTAAIQQESNLSTSVLKKNGISYSLNILSAKPISIVDKESGQARINQWLEQKNQLEQAGLALMSYKLYHRMMLVYIYDEIKAVSNKMYPGQASKQRKYERDIICASKHIVGRTERRFKTSSQRILSVVYTGISFEQLVKVGMVVTDFEAENKYYNQFLLALDLKSLDGKINSTGSLLDPTTMQPIIPKLKTLSLKFKEISEGIETESDDEDEDLMGNNEMELDE
jgi:hypothetical protein